MIGQPPPYALATPTFRFRALASHAGRASLGGDREVALACFVVARLAAGMLPPVSIVPADASVRAAAARQWLASIAVPASTRAAAVAAIDAVAETTFRGAVKGVSALIEAARPHLDVTSVGEMTELLNELASGVSPTS